VFSTGLAMFAYLDVLLTERSPKATFPHAGRQAVAQPIVANGPP
jgi:hypothetical protein